MAAMPQVQTPQKRARGTIAVLGALSLALSGCSTLVSSFNPFAGRPSDSVRLDVENQNYSDVTLYVISDAPRIERRVGFIGGLTNETFTVPWDATMNMSIRLEMLADGSCTMAPVTVSPGDVLGVQVLPVFERNAYCQ